MEFISVKPWGILMTWTLKAKQGLQTEEVTQTKAAVATTLTSWKLLNPWISSRKKKKKKKSKHLKSFQQCFKSKASAPCCSMLHYFSQKLNPVHAPPADSTRSFFFCHQECALESQPTGRQCVQQPLHAQQNNSAEKKRLWCDAANLRATDAVGNVVWSTGCSLISYRLVDKT